MWALWSQETFKILYLQLHYIRVYSECAQSQHKARIDPPVYISLNIFAAGIITV